MWKTKYDENVTENPFFLELQANHSDILAKANKEGWILAVPRAGSVENELLSTDLIFDHILIPTCEPSLFHTLTKKQLNVRNKQLVPMDEGPFRPIPILFEETFYTNNNKTVVFCLEAPLFRPHSANCVHHLNNLETLHDCIDFLWREKLGACLGQVHDLCHDFELDLNHLPANLRRLNEACLHLVAETKPDVGSKVKVAIETYMQSCLNSKLIKAINTRNCEPDAKLNKIIRNSHQMLQLKDLNLEANDAIIDAKHQLAKINDYSTILDKINCFKLTFEFFNNTETETLTADYILQLFVFLIIKIPVNNWTSNLDYITKFRFNSSNDESQFLVATFEAALEFIKSDQFRILIDSKVQTVPVNDELFKMVKDGALEELKQAIEEIHEKAETVEQKNHHPLCSCETCCKNAQPSKHDIKATNDKGQSLLIFATILNRFTFIEFLLAKGCDPNYVDYSGRAALHYAAGRGLQVILLILINSNSQTNLGDNDGNTPLHLACLNGHDNCVKALLYTCRDLDINAPNRRKETPLHLATRWNYTEIMKILLENDAGVHSKNSQRESVFDLTNNQASELILHEFCRRRNFVIEIGVRESVREEIVLDVERKCVDHGQRPKTFDQIKKVDLLLRAIENNDLPLTCFYLGFSSNSDYRFDDKCHPLCNCEKCKDASEMESNAISEAINVNCCNYDGFTPLHFGAQFGRGEIVRILLDSQALPNIKTYKTLQSPLHLACIYGHLAIVKELVNYCEIDCRDAKGNTPLYYACMGNSLRIVEVLVKNGASPDSCNYQGLTILREAEDKCLFSVCKLLNRSEGGSDEDWILL